VKITKEEELRLKGELNAAEIRYRVAKAEFHQIKAKYDHKNSRRSLRNILKSASTALLIMSIITGAAWLYLVDDAWANLAEWPPNYVYFSFLLGLVIYLISLDADNLTGKSKERDRYQAAKRNYEALRSEYYRLYVDFKDATFDREEEKKKREEGFEKAATVRKAREDERLNRRKVLAILSDFHGNPNLVCPHCQEKGGVFTKLVTKKTGISGAKATGAILTGGASLLVTGLSRKDQLTQCMCTNCMSEWIF